MKEKLKKLTDYYGIYDLWKKKVSQLKKTDTHFGVFDFDDTIFSRDQQLAQEPKLVENRGESGNKLMANEFGIGTFTEKYYKGKVFPKTLLSQYEIKNSLILTAGVFEYSMEKIRTCLGNDYTVIVKDTGEEKIIELIRYVIYTLKYIPKSITVYEDRPEYFIEYKELLADILGCEIKIIFVEMNGNSGYKTLREV